MSEQWTDEYIATAMEDAGVRYEDWLLIETLLRTMRDDLCRRVPAPQGSVPDHVRSVLHAALIVYITECRQVDDPDGETLAHQAQQWLDSQRPAPGQGGNDGNV